MRDKVVLGITLSVVLLATLAIYGLVDINRGKSTGDAKREKDIENGKRIYAQYCIQCHGPLGEGCIGPALDKALFRVELDGVPNPDYDEGTGREYLKRTIARGRNSNQPGVRMPGWFIGEGEGSLNDQEIDDVVTFILYGDWGEVLENSASAINMNEPLPSYPGFTDKAKIAKVKEVMLDKGCLNCHQLVKGGGQRGAVLSEVGSRRTKEWLHDWIKDPKAVSDLERGPNLWLIAPTPSLETPGPDSAPTATPIAFQMNDTYMPTIQMTEEELALLVDYLSHAKIAAK